MEALLRLSRAVLRDPVSIRGFSSSSICCKSSKSKKSKTKDRKRPAMNTTLKVGEPERILSRRGYGGTRKLKAMNVNSGYYRLESEDIGAETPILDVVHCNGRSGHLERKIITKSTIVSLDPSLFRARIEQRLKEASTTEDKDDVTASKEERRRKFLESETVYARVTTQPGQVGACNGYILEGQELEDFVTMLSEPK